MPLLIATAHPYWPPPGPSWDLWPFAGMALFVFLARSAFGARVRPWVLAAAVAVGPLYATAVESWGAIPTTAVVAFGAMLIASLSRHPRIG